MLTLTLTLFAISFPLHLNLHVHHPVVPTNFARRRWCPFRSYGTRTSLIRQPPKRSKLIEEPSLEGCFWFRGSEHSRKCLIGGYVQNAGISINEYSGFAFGKKVCRLRTRLIINPHYPWRLPTSTLISGRLETWKSSLTLLLYKLRVKL
jgi:hypothetical protein